MRIHHYGIDSPVTFYLGVHGGPFRVWVKLPRSRQIQSAEHKQMWRTAYRTRRTVTFAGRNDVVHELIPSRQPASTLCVTDATIATAWHVCLSVCPSVISTVELSRVGRCVGLLTRRPVLILPIRLDYKFSACSVFIFFDQIRRELVANSNSIHTTTPQLSRIGICGVYLSISGVNSLLSDNSRTLQKIVLGRNVTQNFWDILLFETRKLCYRKDDRAMHPIHGCLKIFGLPDYAHGYYSQHFHGLLFQSTLWMFLQNLKSVALPVPEIIGGIQKICSVPGYVHAPFSPKFVMGFYSDWPSKCTRQIWSP